MVGFSSEKPRPLTRLSSREVNRGASHIWVAGRTASRREKASRGLARGELQLQAEGQAWPRAVGGRALQKERGTEWPMASHRQRPVGGSVPRNRLGLT